MSVAPHHPDDEAWTALLRPLREPEAPMPRPFFYARLEARLVAGAWPLALPAWLRHPVSVGLLVLLVLTLNIGAAVHYLDQHPAVPTPARNSYAAFITTYHLDPFSLPHE